MYRFLFIALLTLGSLHARAQSAGHGPALAALALTSVPAASPEWSQGDKPATAAQTPVQTTPAEPPVKAVPQTGRQRKPRRIDEAGTATMDEARPARSARGSRAAEMGRGARGAAGAGGAGRARGAGHGRGRAQ
ncbi:hypothetical protein ACFQT0_07145 [Hymenobacter humi]|uniref:Translation initiation factor IF-2 n=1 Tax=Hymenobacter humi TaxID=1411620 RepID=A0ABW2U4F5_9BACT